MDRPSDRLLASTRRRLVVVTFALLALLVVGIAVTSAVAALSALDADVDRALEAAVAAAVANEVPQESGDAEETAPSAADTFLLYLDGSGGVVSNPSRKALPGLPDHGAIDVAARSGRDIRTVESAGVRIRLLTVPMRTGEGDRAGYVQGGFVLELHDQQSASLVAAIVTVAIIGLAAAALVTLVVTGRALVPIRRSFEAQRRFVADASHELRTPLALIRANAEVIEREELVDPPGKPLLADIVAEAGRLGRLVGELLALASSDATDLTIERQRLDLGVLAGDTVREAGALAAERGVEVVAAVDAPVIIEGDPDRLVQLLTILLDNALDHSPSGGTVTVSARRAGVMAELAVEDDGPGVAPADRERVFQPFARLPGDRRARSTGTGLGLAIAQRIVSAHDGTIAVEDAPGGGARFVARLPAA